jgi:DinB superfamily
MASNAVASTVAELFGVVHGKFRDTVEGVDEEALNWSPGPEMNSIAVLVTHTLGSELDTLHRVRGMQMDRDRDAEFAVTSATKSELLAALDRADERLAEHAGAITEADLAAMRERPGRDPQPGIRWLLDNYGHAREHVGHTEMAVQLWKARG